MEEVMGRVVKNGKVIADDLTICLEVTVGAVKKWHGGFFLPEGLTLATGNLYRLELADGRSGEMLVVQQTISSDSPTQVSFVGKGPLLNAPAS